MRNLALPVNQTSTLKVLNMEANASTPVGEGFRISREIAREDTRDRFLVVVDATDWYGHYSYLLQDSVAKKNAQKPFHKVTLRLNIHHPQAQ